MDDLVTHGDDLLNRHLQALFDVLSTAESLTRIWPHVAHEEERWQLSEIHVIDDAERVRPSGARS